MEAGGGCGSLWGQRHWQCKLWGVLIGVSPPGGRDFLTKSRPHPTPCRLQCWDASGQKTNRVGTQPCPLEDRLPNVFLSLQLPTKHIP